MLNPDFQSLIESTRGKFFAVTFTKKDGSTRRMVARLGVRKHVTGKGLRYNPADYGLVCVWDAQCRGYRMVNLKTISRFQCGASKVEVASATTNAFQVLEVAKRDAAFDLGSPAFDHLRRAQNYLRAEAGH